MLSTYIRGPLLVVSTYFHLTLPSPIYQFDSKIYLKGCMTLRCVKKAISYKYPYLIAIVVHDQIYTVVMITICANQKKIVQTWSTQSTLWSHL